MELLFRLKIFEIFEYFRLDFSHRIQNRRKDDIYDSLLTMEGA